MKLETKSLKHLLENLNINQIHSLETWWQDCPPGSGSMPNFSNSPQTGSNQKKENIRQYLR